MSLFQVRIYIYYWSARVAGTAANQMMMVAVGWQMYALTNSAWDLGLVGLLEFLPGLALTLVAGHAADRYDRRLILSLCMVLQAAVSLVLFAAVLGGWESRTLLLVLAVALGVARAFQMPAQQSLVPLLVPADLLPRAISFGSAGNQAAVIVGPALGGLLYVIGAPAVFGVSLALFVVAAVLLTQVKYERAVISKEPVSIKVLLAGVHYIWSRPVVLGAISLDLFAVLLGGATALLPIYAKDILHVGPAGLGLLRGSPAVGALLMSLVLTRWPIKRHVGLVMLGAVAVFGLATIVFGISTSFPLSMLSLLVSGCADMVSVVIRQTLVQLETPDHMRGRVSAVNSVFIGASNQLGEFESGATAAALGPVGSVLLGGIGTLVIAVAWLRLFPALAQRQQLLEPDGARSKSPG